MMIIDLHALALERTEEQCPAIQSLSQNWFSILANPLLFTRILNYMTHRLATSRQVLSSAPPTT